MAFLPAGFGQAVFHFRLSGAAEDQVFTMGYTAPPANTPDEHAATLDGIWTHATNGLIRPSYMSADYTYSGVTVTEEHGVGPVVAQFSHTVAGSVGGSAALPPNCSCLVRKNTGLGGRAGRGRMFLPGGFLGEGEVSPQGVITGTKISNLQTGVTGSLLAMTSSGLIAVVLHTNASPSPTPITALVVQGLIATQRRRLR